MVYNVSEILEDLEGHEGIADREIKIKLADGSVREIAGFEFRNACIGGDDIIYLCEEDPIRKEYFKRVKMFVEFCNDILDVCNKTYKQLDYMFDGDFDPMDILHIENEIAKSCDDWFRWLKLDIKYEPGCGTEEELYFKIGVLESWLERKEIPKEVPVF